METINRKLSGILIVAIVSSVLALSLLQPPRALIKDTAKANLGGIHIVAIGESTPLYKKVLDALKRRGAAVAPSDDIPSSTKEIKEGMFVIFDGDWIKERVENKTVHAFLGDIVPRRVKLAAVGGNTSKFFEALDQAGIYKILVTETGEVRNPAYWNPPLVGYRIKEKDGQVGESLLFSNTDNVDTLIEALLGEW